MTFTLNENIQSLLYIGLIILSIILITRVVTFIMRKIGKFEGDMTRAYLIRDIINYAVIFSGAIMILQFFGIDIAATLVSVGIVGIAVSFASKDIISNLFSGIILIVKKSIKLEDTIEIHDKKGVVKKISLRSTTIVDDNGVKTIIPNSTLTNNEYKSFKSPEKYRVDIMAGLILNNDIEEFEKFIVDKIKTYQDICEKPHPEVFIRDLTFEQTNVKVSFWIKDLNKKDKYKLIITNDIRKFSIGERDE